MRPNRNTNSSQNGLYGGKKLKYPDDVNNKIKCSQFMVLTAFWPQSPHSQCYSSFSTLSLRQPVFWLSSFWWSSCHILSHFCFSGPHFLSLEFTNCSLLFSMSKESSLKKIAQQCPGLPGEVPGEEVNEVFRWTQLKSRFVYFKIAKNKIK